MVILPIVSAGALDAGALCCSTLFIVGAIAIAILLDVMALLIAIVVRAGLCIAWRKLALCLVCAALVFACANFNAELVFELEMRAFFDALELHALECAIIFILVELGFKTVCDGLKSLGLELLSGSNKFVAVIFMKWQIKPLKRKRIWWLWPVAGWQGFGSLHCCIKAMKTTCETRFLVLKTKRLSLKINGN